MRPARLVSGLVALVVLGTTWSAPAARGEPSPAHRVAVVPLTTDPAISSGLSAALDDLAPGESTTVLVTMRRQADIESTGPGRQHSREVVSELRATARVEQQSVARRLREWSAAGKVTRVEPLWVVDALSVTATEDVVRRIAARADVESVAPDAIDILPAAVAPEPNLSTIRAPDVWGLGDRGQGVVVATLDTGVDGTHPDLAGRWRGGAHSWFDPYGQHPAGPVDLDGHGTATMGAIVGGDAGGTAIGVAPGAQWIAARIFDDRGNASTTAIHQAFQWLLDPDGDPVTDDAPDVVNGSWSLGAGPGCDLTFQPDVQALVAAGITPVFAAGNFGSGSGSSASPANYPEALAVGALATSGSVLNLSSRGPSDCGGRGGQFPDLVAPGQDIATTAPYGGYQTGTGTSLAAPHVTGALALLLSAARDLGVAERRDLLLGTAVDLGAPGVDSDYGWGRVDAMAAYEAALAVQPPPPPLPTALEYSTVGGVGPPGVAGPADDADVYAWDTAEHRRALDLSATPYSLPSRARVDGFARRSATRFLVSFADDVRVPGLGAVQDEDVVAFDGTRWRLWFDGSAHGLRRPACDVDALAVSRGVLYFSTSGRARPPGVRGPGDDADIYRWDRHRFRRVWDATAHGLPGRADVDGLDLATATHFWVSLAASSTRVPTLGQVQDEDVLLYAGGAWSVQVDGTAAGLTLRALDVDALDIP